MIQQGAWLAFDALSEAFGVRELQITFETPTSSGVELTYDSELTPLAVGEVYLELDGVFDVRVLPRSWWCTTEYFGSYLVPGMIAGGVSYRFVDQDENGGSAHWYFRSVGGEIEFVGYWDERVDVTPPVWWSEATQASDELSNFIEGWWPDVPPGYPYCSGL